MYILLVSLLEKFEVVSGEYLIVVCFFLEFRGSMILIKGVENCIKIW